MGCNCKGANPSYGTKAQPRVIDQQAIDTAALASMPARPVRRVQELPGQFARGK